MNAPRAALLGLLRGVRPAAASPLFELVGAGQGRGGLNPRVSARGAAATYFNPALLARQSPSLELGVFLLSDQIGITLDARDGPLCPARACDVPLVRGSAPESFRHADGRPIASPAVPTSWLEEGRPAGEGDRGLPRRPRQSAGTGHNVRPYQMIGLVAPIFRDRLVLGLHAMIPLREFTTARAFYNDEREQYFSNSLHPELYSDRMTATSLAFGAGARVISTLQLGFAFTLSLTNKASVPVYVSNLSDLDTVLLDSNIGVETAVSPHFGASWEPIPSLRLAATVHTPQAFEIETGFDYFLSTGSKQGATVRFTHDYMPLTLAVGAEQQLGEAGGHAFGVAGTVTFARWSQYRDRHAERPHPDYGWSDTVSGALGLRHQRGELSSWLDVTYQPSPVPDQTGRSNYVDNDRLGTSAGVDYRFGLWGASLSAGLLAQAHHLFYRHAGKLPTPANPQPNPGQPGFAEGFYPQLVIDEVPDDAIDGQLREPIPGRGGLQTNNPGFPGFASEGWIVGSSVYLAVHY